MRTVATTIAFTILSLAGYAQADFDKQLQEFTIAFNKQCPITLDKETRLDSATAKAGRTIQYNYTMVNMDVVKIDPKAFREILAPNLLNTVKTNEGLKPFRDNGVIFIYHYDDKNGKAILHEIIPPAEYNR